MGRESRAGGFVGDVVSANKDGVIASRKREVASHATSTGGGSRRAFVDKTAQLGKIARKIPVSADFPIAQRVPASVSWSFVRGICINILLHPPCPPGAGRVAVIVIGARRIDGLARTERRN